MNKVLFIFATLILAVSFCKKEQKPGSLDGKMWNGGKAQAPVSVSADYTSSIKPNGSAPFTLKVTPGVACSTLTTTLTGLNGAVISDTKSQGCSQGQEFTHTANVAVGSDTAGYVSATVSFDNGGQIMSTTKAFAVRSNNTGFASKIQTANAANPVSETNDGSRVIILPSETR